ncbi:hypothetical protein QN345_00635 [Cryobacterium sp. 10I1]|uniref:YqaJ viral recombinase family protein n=1 Tax=Cryobacterium sp. 10I1 TaxID=3048578 RepID=UPI002B23ED4A|nr:YqaJ viral recombinase family protein [Cryobacterium sp. 10I1]MEB0303846.1 hypothetical protein [Cryobacterium sp. 10I1]
MKGGDVVTAPATVPDAETEPWVDLTAWHAALGYTPLVQSEDRQAWMTVRSGGVTATDVATIASAGAAGRARLKAEKLGQARGFGGNKYTDHGRAREVYIAGWVDGEFDIPASTWVVAALDNPKFLATPDGIGEDAGSECKTTMHPWPTRSDVPRRYIDQCQWGMRVTGKSRWLFAWEEHENFVPTHMEPKWFWIERDEERIAVLEALALEFLAEVAEPYKPTEYDELIATYLERKAILDAAKSSLDETDAEIRALLAGKDKVTAATPFGNLSWSTPKPSATFDKAAFQAAHPRIYARFAGTTQNKPSLRIAAGKEAKA